MYKDEIIITAYNSSTEQYRLTRLSRVVGYVCALADYYGNETVLSKINELHDHKGTLTVTWNVEATAAEKEFILKAWESSIGDRSNNVEHHLDEDDCVG